MKVLITAGAVGSYLDDNKLVTNRSRGIWAQSFAEYLADKGHAVTFLVPDTYSEIELADLPKSVQVLKHRGYDNYAGICGAQAPIQDAAVLAAAVVNWLPAETIKGKMATKGYTAGDIIQVPFKLMPRVIDAMRILNPKLTLIGCKMLSGATEGGLVDAAHDVIDHAKAHVVVANDLSNLKSKLLVYPDGAVIRHNLHRDPRAFFWDLEAVINDKHYTTISTDNPTMEGDAEARTLFDAVVTKYRHLFTPTRDGRVHGAVAVRAPLGWLVSGRRKVATFTSAEAVRVIHVDRDTQQIRVCGGLKASMNAPLLITTGEAFKAQVVIHLHDELPDVPVYTYAPPGTQRDDRHICAPVFNIEHHGFVACLGSDLQVLTKEHKEIVHGLLDGSAAGTECGIVYPGNFDRSSPNGLKVTCPACIARQIKRAL
jgi:hypothetical protein